MNESQFLEELVDRKPMHEQVKNVFPSENSFLWFIRQNREELKSFNAIFIIGHRMKCHPSNFKKAVLQIGARRFGQPEEQLATQ
jgi:hypothetical protein